jgi:hypothetical protein
MWNSIISAVFLHITLVAGETPHFSTATDTTSTMWYTQIGTWHLIQDTLAKTAHIYHNAAIDGARSGMARADLKYNRQISNITRLSVKLSPGRTSSAGVLLKDKRLAYGIYLEKGTAIDSVRIIRRFEKQQVSITAFDVAAADTQFLDITIRPDSLRINVGKISRSIGKPADLPAETIVALSCERGDVRVWRVRIEAPPLHINETFLHATVLNLGMERMFQAGRKRDGQRR